MAGTKHPESMPWRSLKVIYFCTNGHNVRDFIMGTFTLSSTI